MLALNIKNTGLRLRTLGYFIIKEHVNAIIMVVVFNIACNVLVYHISNSIYISKLKEHKAPLVAKQVSLILLDILQQTNSLMRDVGESILQSDNDNLAEIYNDLQDYDNMLVVTNQLTNPSRKNPFPGFSFIIEAQCYPDTGTYCHELHAIAQQRSAQTNTQQFNLKVNL